MPAYLTGMAKLRPPPHQLYVLQEGEKFFSLVIDMAVFTTRGELSYERKRVKILLQGDAHLYLEQGLKILKENEIVKMNWAL